MTHTVDMCNYNINDDKSWFVITKNWYSLNSAKIYN